MVISLDLLSSGQSTASIKDSMAGEISVSAKYEKGQWLPNRNFALFTNLCSTGPRSESQVVLQNHGQLTDARMD